MTVTEWFQKINDNTCVEIALYAWFTRFMPCTVWVPIYQYRIGSYQPNLPAMKRQ
jgi:hypothetical protein